tara:strand:- start:4781 stop:5470 length:690 start_codon:yes stop_codon:yes gene_type:complete
MCDKNSGSTSECTCCACYGPQGPQGVAGMQGAQGIQGATGIQGQQGNLGSQGLQGLQGLPGKDCDDHKCHCVEIYLSAYSLTPQYLGAYSSATDAVIFDLVSAVSVGDFDLSLMASTGKVIILKRGIYNLVWKLQARTSPPIPTLVPSWAFAFFVNGTVVPGSNYSGFTQAPSDEPNHSSGNVQMELQVGDQIMVRNTCPSAVSLDPSPIGSVFPITIAGVNIDCVKAL